MGLANEPLERNIKKCGIAHVSLFIRGSSPHGFTDESNIVSRIVAEGGKVKVLENVQHFEQHDATTRRVVGSDIKPAVVAAKGIRYRRVIRRQVFPGQQSAVSCHVGGNLFSNVTFVEGSPAMVSNAR